MNSASFFCFKDEGPNKDESLGRFYLINIEYQNSHILKTHLRKRGKYLIEAAPHKNVPYILPEA